MHRIGRLKHGYQFWQKGGGHKKRFQYCFNPNYLHQFQYFRAVTVVPVRVLSGPASENSTHPLRQVVSWPTSQASTRCIFDGGFVICPVFVVLDEGFVFVQVDLNSGLCDLGNAQDRTLHWANFPDDPVVLGFSGIRCSLRPHPLIFLGNHSSLQRWFKWGRLAKVPDSTPTAALAALLTPHHGLHFVFQCGDFVKTIFLLFTSLVSETGLHSRLQVLVRLLELILNAGLDVDLETFYSECPSSWSSSSWSPSASPQASSPTSQWTPHANSSTWKAVASGQVLELAPSWPSVPTFGRPFPKAMLHGFMISRTHVLAATIVQHGRGRDHGHIQCCFLPSLELGQIWQSVVQPFRLRLNVCRIQRSYSEKHHRSFSIMAVSRNRCCTTEWNTTQSSPQEQKPLPATKRSTHENTKG